MTLRGCVWRGSFIDITGTKCKGKKIDGEELCGNDTPVGLKSGCIKIDCTKCASVGIINELYLLESLQVGANGHPCPLHLNPPSVADFPFAVGHL